MHDSAQSFVMDGDFKLELLPRLPYDVSYFTSVPMIGFAFETQGGVDAIGSDHKRDFVRYPLSLSFIPSNCDVKSCSLGGGEYLVVSCVSGYSQSLLGGDHDTYSISNLLSDEAILAANRLRSLLLQRVELNHSNWRELSEIMCGAIWTHVRGGDSKVKYSDWLNVERLLAVEELIDRHLEEGICVSDMASAFNVSTGFFVKAFRARMDLTPHRYLIMCRVLAARKLIQYEHMSLIEVALICGFANQAHMTTCFRKQLGVTPAIFRLKS